MTTEDDIAITSFRQTLRNDVNTVTVDVYGNDWKAGYEAMGRTVYLCWVEIETGVRLSSEQARDHAGSAVISQIMDTCWEDYFGPDNTQNTREEREHERIESAILRGAA